MALPRLSTAEDGQQRSRRKPSRDECLHKKRQKQQQQPSHLLFKMKTAVCSPCTAAYDDDNHKTLDIKADSLQCWRAPIL